MHKMKLYHDSFVKIKEQTKTIEMRLSDEKRSSISVGDTIIFSDTSNNEKIECLVSNIYRYPSFEELYRQHDKVSIGYNKDEIANPKDMLAYYSKEMIEQYGVVAIEIQVR
ncbi:MAG: ASCH domain-containing protein [Treponema sp.]|nr:ASCH domain-containing protein [Candidatus Treponema merdequi]